MQEGGQSQGGLQLSPSLLKMTERREGGGGGRGGALLVWGEMTLSGRNQLVKNTSLPEESCHPSGGSGWSVAGGLLMEWTGDSARSMVSYHQKLAYNSSHSTHLLPPQRTAVSVQAAVGHHHCRSLLQHHQGFLPQQIPLPHQPAD